MATYYIDPVSGNDTHAGTSFATAYATIAKAATVVAAGDTVRLCATDPHTLTSSVTWTAAGSPGSPIVVTGANAAGAVDGTKATVTSATNSVDLFTLAASHRMAFQNLSLTHTAGTRGRGFLVQNAGGPVHSMGLQDVSIDGCSVGVSADNSVTNPLDGLVCHRVEIKNCTSVGASLTAGGKFIDCWIHGNSGDGIDNGGSVGGAAYQFDLVRTVLSGNGGCGLDVKTSTAITTNVPPLVSLVNCDVHGNTSDGIKSVQGSGTEGYSLVLENNIIQANGGWGVNLTSTPLVTVNLNNAYRTNTSGNLNGLSAGTGDATLTGDPFTSTATGDFSLNNTAGAGAACRAAGFPGAVLFGTGYADIGAVQHQDAGGGSTISVQTTNSMIFNGLQVIGY